ncbi:Lrp/AsnC family transcriptional regulator [Pseudomonas syringae]|uniref:Winged helix-turn-helix transcriptional regulator n=2 Tax=Pseudomonas syringae group TaxID=136849 RepID=A0A9Q4A275_PSESX|nr:Lrp/AsnC family transcriptional regulator [Pseudomonas syringae]MCF5469376.1 winged helix-turn-helix transcriptional regulator [Pseudomonas syringae]MCF5475660.1 winged helix-turn-helix transcriptional regulator [Pseudomonas syringae]MCF5485551.1 winged helix-turn-helix transcriptional regulator [Pseudomonas syringae]MCF5490006.1 winged helix-turn-helix transcriptional regulator [Pseudomonas syringae]MCF5494714.1 winged helix-turn-helix transcriptional regulator [Pseudomonas syringae]
MKRKSSSLDSVDLQILSIMQSDGRTTLAKLSEKLSLSETPCWRRLKRLEEEGYIKHYQAVLDKHVLGFDITAFIQLSVDSHTPESTRDLEQKLTSSPEVVALYNVTGDFDFMIHIVCYSMEAYSRFIELTLRSLKCIKQIKTSVSLREVYANNNVPLSSVP